MPADGLNKADPKSLGTANLGKASAGKLTRKLVIVDRFEMYLTSRLQNPPANN